MATVHCTAERCDATATISHRLLPEEIYDELRHCGWNPAPALCREHSYLADAVYDRMTDAERRAAVGYLLEQGRHLEDLPNSWTTEDAFVTTESLIEAYQSFILPRESSEARCTCGNSRHPEDTAVTCTGCGVKGDMNAKGWVMNVEDDGWTCSTCDRREGE